MSESPDDHAVVDEGEGSGDRELISERQLGGRELPNKTVSLTFDDGPGERTAELADYLASEGISATFFINGMRVGGRQSAIDSIVGRGHTLANHTQNHRQLTKLEARSVVAEVADTDEVIAAAQPQGPFLLRAPFGAWSGPTAAALNATPLRKYVGSVFWEIGGELTETTGADWACWSKRLTVDECTRRYLREVQDKRRGIVLLHDIHDKTVDMVKELVVALKAGGYSFVPLEAVPSIKRALAAGPDSEVSGCASATLGRHVPDGSCVQSRNDRKFYRCAGEEWVRVAGPDDAACTGQKFPLADE